MYILHINSLMKIILKQLWELIFRYRKKIIYWVLAFFICQICFLWLWNIWLNNKVLADNVSTNTQSTASQEKFSARLNIAKFFQKVVYILIYPILVVVGKLVDNSLVYGESFWFDIILWQLWVLVRNIANFALWFIFIFYIFKYLITQDQKHGPKRLIIRALIAWVWIQASWFIMAALIDISTILTYWVWGLPVSVLWSSTNNEWNNPYVLKTLVSVDVEQLDDMAWLYLTNVSTWNDHFYISECSTFDYSSSWTDIKEELILAPKYVFYREENSGIDVYHNTDKLRCHYYGQVYYFKSLYSGLNDWDFNCSDSTGCKEWQQTYKNIIQSAQVELKSGSWNSIVDMGNYISQWKILQIWDAHAEGWIWWSNVWTWRYSTTWVWLDVDNKWTWEWKTNRLEDILDWGSYVWVFTTLYSSLMNAWRWILSSGWSLYTNFLNIVLTFFHMLAIAIPLIAMCVVFMIRVAILWMVVALAPFIVLMTSFDLWGSSMLKSVKILDYFKPENLLWIIFSPALICFAISISTVLVRVIETFNIKEIAFQPTDILWWLIHINLEWLWIGLWRFIVAIMWVAITWFLVWRAVKFSKIWETGIIKWMEEIVWKAITSTPIIPIPWKGAVSWGAVKETIRKEKNKLDNYEADTAAIENLLHPEEQEKKWLQNRYEKYNEWIDKRLIEDLRKGDWTEMGVLTKIWNKEYNIRFRDLNPDEQKNIIGKINEMSDSGKRAEFWKTSSQVSVWNDIYKFRTTAKVLGKDKKQIDIEINKYFTDEGFKKYIEDQWYSLPGNET